MKNKKLNAALGLLGIVIVLIYGITQIVAGCTGIKHALGGGWMIAAIIAFFCGFSLPMTVGSFFGAMNVWGWPWYGALVFALPGLAYMLVLIPGFLSDLLKKKDEWFSGK